MTAVYLTVQGDGVAPLHQGSRGAGGHRHVGRVEHVHIHGAGLAGAQVVGGNAGVDVDVGPVHRVQHVDGFLRQRLAGGLAEPAVGGGRVGVRHAGQRDRVLPLLARLQQGVAHRDVGWIWNLQSNKLALIPTAYTCAPYMPTVLVNKFLKKFVSFSTLDRFECKRFITSQH